MLTLKRMSLQEAVSLIQDGCSVAIGGASLNRRPMAAVHEIIRQRKKNLTVYGLDHAMELDLLAGAGCVKEVHSSSVGLADLGEAKNFRQAVGRGDVKFVELPETAIRERFKAGADGIGFVPSRIPAHAFPPVLLNEAFAKKAADPFTGEEVVALKAFAPDVAIIHAQYADRKGNVIIDPRKMTADDPDVSIAKSAKRLIVTVEQIVSDETILERSDLVLLAETDVDAVVEVPYGAHPASCNAQYDRDAEHLRLYLEMTGSPGGTEKYIGEYILGANDWNGYLKKIGLGKILRITREFGVA